MPTRITVQPAAQNTRAPLPYPFHVDVDGNIGRQDFWRGRPLRVLGFVNNLRRTTIDLTWEAAVSNPETAVDRYLITEDADGRKSVHTAHIDSMTVRDDAQVTTWAP